MRSIASACSSSLLNGFAAASLSLLGGHNG
jgi:hypothetical protein